MSQKKTAISLIGNPNCGKTTLFNQLTGAKQHVGNWPGVTVEQKIGQTTIGNRTVEVIDLPGSYAIETEATAVSHDELVVNRFLIEDEKSLIINILDAANLQRNMYLTCQLLDMQRPMIVVLNMMDAAKLHGIEIDIAELQTQLGCPVIAISAKRKTGLDALYAEILTQLDHPTCPAPQIHTLDETFKTALLDCHRALPPSSPLKNAPRWTLLNLLCHFKPADARIYPKDAPLLQTFHQQLTTQFGEDLDIALASARYTTIDTLAENVIRKVHLSDKSLTQRLDKIALGKLSGIPVFLLIMFFMFVIAINFGSAFIDFFDIAFGTIFVEGTQHVLHNLHAPTWLISILSNGLGAGIQTVATFIPVIAAMFLCLSFLEDSGYLARAAMVVDRGMRAIGLPGKAFVPMLVGFGCNVPAIMGTRTLENNRDRLMSIMMIPYISCGARLPVYALFAAIFFPSNGGFVVYMLYLLGIAVAIITGLMLKHSLLKGPNTPFIMELPPYHLPTLKGLLLLTWDKLKGFILRAGKAIIIMVMLLSVLNSVGTDGSFGHENSDKSVLAAVGKGISPAFSPMGVTQENWPATVGIFTGLFAKEAVIGTLNALYAQMNPLETPDEEAPYDFWQGIHAALATIPANLSDVMHNLTDPLGFNQKLADGDLSTIQEDNEIDNNAVSQIQSLFVTPQAAIAYLIFILLYTPCTAALGAVYREVGTGWTLTVAFWSFILAWICATGYYQITQLGRNPHAIFWLLGLAVTWLVLFLGLKVIGRRTSLLANLRAPSDNTKGGCC